MDNSIIVIIAFAVVVVGLAIAAELILTIIGGIIGMVVFFIPGILIACGAKKFGLNDGVCALAGFVWIIFACVMVSKVIG